MKNIILAGLMGSGKTSVAEELRKNLPSYDLIETDKIIEEKEKISINDIFTIKGENYFRKLEKTIIDEILVKESQIISLGGGSLENDFDFEQAKKNSVIFYMKADVDILFERIKNNKDRPLLNCKNPKEKLTELLSKRGKNYEKADFIIDVNEISIKEAAKEIEEIYKYGTN